MRVLTAETMHTLYLAKYSVLACNNNLASSVPVMPSPAALEIIMHIKLPWGSGIEQLFPFLVSPGHRKGLNLIS